MSLRSLTFHRVLHRPGLFLGGEREPTMMVAVIAGAVGVAGMNFVSIATGLIIWMLSIPAFRAMAKYDPHLVKVFIRARRYRGYYPPRSRPYRVAGLPGMSRKGRM